jgi:hypothetical protein
LHTEQKSIWTAAKTNKWNKQLHDNLTKGPFKKFQNDPCLYSKQESSNWMYLSIHVDDLIAAATATSRTEAIEKQMKSNDEGFGETTVLSWLTVRTK